MSQPLDTNNDGYVDAVALDTNADGYVDAYVFDQNQNGYIDGVAVDASGDGVIDTVGSDANEDGYIEAWAPAVSPAVTDSGYVPSGIVGGAPSYDGVGGLVNDLAAETGTATYGTPDTDGDGYIDTADAAPYDDDYY